MLKFSEVYEKQIRTTNERPDGSDFIAYTTGFDTRDCLINPEYIVAVPSSLKRKTQHKKLAISFLKVQSLAL